MNEAVAALAHAAESLGIRVRDDPAADIALDIGGRLFLADVRRVSLVTAGDVAGLSQRGRPTVVVAERVVGEARDAMRRAGHSWLDLRGHLYLTGPGVLVDADVPSQWEAPERRGPFTGTAGIDVACALLLEPDEPVSVRGLARRLGRSPSTVSEVVAALDRDGLVGSHRLPQLPDLFWATAEAWRPQVVLLETLPGATTAAVLHVRPESENEIGWVVGDTLAATMYDAPIGSPAEYPPDFHVPSEAALRRAARVLGVPPPGGAAAATARVAPTRLVCAKPIRDRRLAWPLAHPVFVALDLAADPGRGREVVQQWDPPTWARRVW